MQFAKQGFQLSLVATLLAAAASAHALLPAQPAASAQLPEAVKPVTAAAVQAVAMGKPAAGDQGTLRELELLQRQTALAEARKKLNDLQGVPTPPQPASMAATASMPSFEGTSPTRSVRANRSKTRPSAEAPVMPPAPSGPSFDAFPPPPERVLKLIVVGSRSRADLVNNGRIITVKVGDRLGRWTVTDIGADGVFVERRAASTGSSAAQEPPEAGEGQVSAPASRDYQRAMLQKATDIDLAGVPQAAAALPKPAVVNVPPLPQGIRPDSSYLPPNVQPLQPLSTP